MRRITMLLTVVALMTVMLAMSVAPAFAGAGRMNAEHSCFANIFSWSNSDGHSQAPFCPGVKSVG